MADEQIDTSCAQPSLPLEPADSNTSPGPLEARFWGNAKPPTPAELTGIIGFGEYDGFDPSTGSLRNRVTLEIADLRQATRIVVYHHYLHRGRTMAQLPYWVLIDGVAIGVLLYAYPRLLRIVYRYDTRSG